jgi:hypothetical protein
MGEASPVRGDAAYDPPSYCNGQRACRALGSSVYYRNVGAWALTPQHLPRVGSERAGRHILENGG